MSEVPLYSPAQMPTEGVSAQIAPSVVGVCVWRPCWYRGTLLMRNFHSLGPYRRPLPRALRWSWGGGAVSYERGTPVVVHHSLRIRTGAGIHGCRGRINQGLCLRGMEETGGTGGGGEALVGSRRLGSWREAGVPKTRHSRHTNCLRRSKRVMLAPSLTDLALPRFIWCRGVRIL